ncbi:hypothetical protein SteCoe_6822 [Stentor coeruleus]|uniref:cGMP-dependent protein kinase n=1 Tax=Stentor coeruleus TaxID=5963 RepID=A0A1R2CP21_9CILI|nr:hypothetical protein SteCoe_6822 [Stentor coeruleus]
MGTGCMKIDTTAYTKLKENDNSNKRASVKNKTGLLGRLSRGQSNTYIEASAAYIDVNAVKSPDDKQMILHALNNHFIFTSLTDEDKEIVAETMQLYVFDTGKVVFEQDKPSRSYYVVKYGILEVLVNGRRVSKIHPTEGFGELALLHDNPRSATVRTLEKSAMWGIERTNFRRVIEEMNTMIYEQNREFLEKVPLLQPLNAQQKDSLAASLVSCKYNAGEKIITEGDEGMHLYIIRDGCVSVQKGTKEIARLYTGDFFGEMTLLYKVPRQASCVAVEGIVKCVALSREDLQKALGNQLTEIIEKNTILEALNKSHKLYYLSKDQKESILRDLEYKTYKAGDVVIPNQSSCQGKLYIVISGRLHYARTSQIFAEKASCIGDEYVTLKNQDQARYEDDMIAGCDAKVGELTKYKFENSIGGKYKEVVRENNAMNVLRRVYLFSSLDSKTLKELFSMIDIKKYKDSEVVFKEGALCENVYIVKRGKINVIKNGKIVRTICKHDYVGERGILFDKTTSASCVADGTASLWIISKNNFIHILNEKMRAQLYHRIQMQDEDATLQTLEIIKRIGKGVFGRVYLSRVKKTDKLYGLKVIPRRKIELLVLHEHIIQERNILTTIDSPFIAKLVKTFKDERRVYFLLEYIHGLELNSILKHVGLLSNNDCLFYMGSLILALQYLHERDIIYRDLKPSNIMIDARGYVKLIDFGSAKITKGRTYTLIGSPHYIAPEAIVGKGYNKAADVWSLGVCLFEFLCGRVPFGEDFEDPYDIYEAILEYNLVFPNDIEQPTDAAKNFILQLLSKFPEFRCSGGIDNLKRHEWFNGFDWDALLKLSLNAPYTPDVGDPLDDIDDEMAEENEGLINNESIQSMENPIEINDPELDEYRKTMSSTWDKDF